MCFGTVFKLGAVGAAVVYCLFAGLAAGRSGFGSGAAQFGRTFAVWRGFGAGNAFNCLLWRAISKLVSWFVLGWVTEDGSYVTNEFISYVRPLIQGDVSPVMVDGIPRHLYTPKELSER